MRGVLSVERLGVRFSILAAALSLSVAPGVLSQEALACASCGSGGDDPLVLYPNHDWRFHLGVTRAFGFRTVKADGSLGSEAAPRFKDALTLAVGKALRSDAALTLVVPYLQNWRDGRYKRSFGDPLVTLRWTVLAQDISEPWIPQAQLILAHRFAQARAPQEAQNGYLLDAFGQGVPESKLGIDIFNGMSDLKAGVAFSALFPGERHLAGRSYSPGFGTRTTFTLGYGRAGWGKALLGVTRETRREKRLDGAEVPASRVVDNGLFATVDAEVTNLHMARVTWARRSAIARNKNGSRNDAFTVAWQWGIAP